VKNEEREKINKHQKEEEVRTTHYLERETSGYRLDHDSAGAFHGRLGNPEEHREDSTPDTGTVPTHKRRSAHKLQGWSEEEILNVARKDEPASSHIHKDNDYRHTREYS